MDIVNRISQLRDERGWTNYRMSVEAGLGSTTVINWFKRNVQPKFEAVEALCNAFGISLSEFFNDTGSRISLSCVQSEFLDEFDKLNHDEKCDLLRFVKTMNSTRIKFQ